MRACRKRFWVAGGTALPIGLTGLAAWAVVRTLSSGSRALVWAYFDEHRGPIVLGLFAAAAILPAPPSFLRGSMS